MIISLNLTDIVAGYDEVTRQEISLRQRWRQPLLENYAKRRSLYEDHKKRYQKQDRRRKVFFLSGMLLFLFLIVSGAVVAFEFILGSGERLPLSNFTCLSPILCIGGVGVAIVLGGAYIYLPSPIPPVPPIHPLKEQDGSILPAITSQWRQGLIAPPGEKQPDEGYAGELLFINRLENIPIQQLILHRLVQNEGDDLDVVVISERGLWLFEVKYWKGAISHENGEWQQRKTFRGPGGFERTNRRKVENHPDHQWQRMKDEILITLNKHLPENSIRIEDIKVQGGILFAHPKSKINIPKGSGFNWGNTSFWINHYIDSPSDPIFSNERNAMLIADILLKRHQQVVGASQLKSMKEYAEQLVQQADQEINSYCKLHQNDRTH